jgi:hypothetical protein
VLEYFKHSNGAGSGKDEKPEMGLSEVGIGATAHGICIQRISGVSFYTAQIMSDVH